jgi:hypothetical protein
LEAENAKLLRHAERAETELQKASQGDRGAGNVSALLGESLEPRGAIENRSTER